MMRSFAAQPFAGVGENVVDGRRRSGALFEFLDAIADFRGGFVILIGNRLAQIAVQILEAQFPFKGALRGPDLAQAGPRSLRERAETLGGTLAVTSDFTGSTIEISIPVSGEPICA